MRSFKRWLRSRRRSIAFGLTVVLAIIVLRNIQRQLTHNRIKDRCDAYSQLIKITKNSTSPELPYEHKSSRNVFQTHPSWTTFIVNSSKFGDIHLYSAFVADGIVSFTAIIERKRQYDGLYCVINSGEATVTTIVEEAPEHHDYSLTSAFIRCAPIKLKHYKIVKLVCKNHESIEIKIHSFYKPVETTANPVVCVRPLYGNYEETNGLIEFLAYYFANGIENFIFFDESIANKTREVLDSLKGVNIRVLPWNLSPSVSKNVHANGQIVAAHYCLTHNPYDQIILVDVDEFIVPSKGLTLRNYVDNSLKQKPSILAMVIRMTVVCDEMNYLRHSASTKYDLKILNNNRRQASNWHYEHRSKLIILKPHLVKFTGIHNTWEYVGDIKRKTRPFYGRTEYVDANELLLYHFRSCCIFTQPYIYGIELDMFSYHTLADDVVVDSGIRRFEANITAFIDMQQSRG